MDDVWLPFRPSGKIESLEAVRGRRDMGTYVIEVTEINSEVRCDLRGHLEAAIASEATKMTVGAIMHMDSRVIKVSDFKSGVI